MPNRTVCEPRHQGSPHSTFQVQAARAQPAMLALGFYLSHRRPDGSVSDEALAEFAILEALQHEQA